MAINNKIARNIVPELHIIFTAILLIVWSIPHTIGVRNVSGFILLLSALPFLMSYIRKNGLPDPIRYFWTILFVLTIWILLQALFISSETMWSLQEIRGQWDVPLLFALLGVSLASPNLDSNLYIRVIVFCLIILIAHYVIEAIQDWHFSGTLTTRRGSIFGSPTSPSYINAFILAFLIAELYVYFFDRSKLILKLPISLTLIFIVLVAFATYLTRIRLGVAGIVALLISGSILVAAYKKPKTAIASLFLLITATALSVYHYYDDGRWNRLIDTIDTAVDTEKNEVWVTTGTLPEISGGTTAGASNYARMAMAKQGLTIIYEKPLGIGFGRNAYGHEMSRRYGDSISGNLNRGHSHSGLIDWTIGTGIPGLLLWLWFVVYILLYSAKEGFGKEKNPYAVALFLITMSMLYRSVVDGTLRDHMLQMNMFLIAFLFAKVSFSKTPPIDQRP